MKIYPKLQLERKRGRLRIYLEGDKKTPVAEIFLGILPRDETEILAKVVECSFQLLENCKSQRLLLANNIGDFNMRIPADEVKEALQELIISKKLLEYITEKPTEALSK